MRARLAELASSLDALESDASPEAAAELLSRRQMASVALAAMRGSAGGLPARRLPGNAEARILDLFSDVDAAGMDPIGQRARLVIAREKIAEALEQPQRPRVLAEEFSKLEQPEVRR